ncbi:ANM_HP_G0242850.mRNA.1.CDS.1 [Saccharomyces cerevisiae]|nr:ANM_HP_G0242850.mRNA.1.CDS.1 [Saccharomyces cerevisiae]CAI7002479.1 ANM_HP_G0242850.mRNA.1.CDS.1 [Saccharomyces cerevisiae]
MPNSPKKPTIRYHLYHLPDLDNMEETDKRGTKEIIFCKTIYIWRSSEEYNYYKTIRNSMMGFPERDIL